MFCLTGVWKAGKEPCPRVPNRSAALLFRTFLLFQKRRTAWLHPFWNNQDVLNERAALLFWSLEWWFQKHEVIIEVRIQENYNFRIFRNKNMSFNLWFYILQSTAPKVWCKLKDSKYLSDISYYTHINNTSFIAHINCNTDNSLSLTLCKPLVLETYFNFASE